MPFISVLSTALLKKTKYFLPSLIYANERSYRLQYLYYAHTYSYISIHTSIHTHTIYTYIRTMPRKSIEMVGVTHNTTIILDLVFVGKLL